MPMSPRLLRPMASGATHPEARDWASRVTANGGTVSSTTLAAVDKFCRDIDATSGLRAAILRCNLFCGNSDANLAAVRTPLYLSDSPGGSVVGNTIDTNFNFAAGDYAETGASGGLKGNGSTKYLRTGVRARQPPFTFASLQVTTGLHVSWSAIDAETTGTATIVGGNGQFNGTGWMLQASPRRWTGSSEPSSTSTGMATAPSATSVESHLIGNRAAVSNTVTLFRDGQSIATGTGGSTFADGGNHEWGVLANVNNSTTTANQFSAARIRMYSIGYNLTAAQALAFSNAVIAFNTSLGRV